MKIQLLALMFLAGCNAASSVAPTEGAIGFDGPTTAAWRAGSTGGSGPAATWEVRADPRAISAPNALAMTAQNHESEERFNLYWSEALRFQNGRIAVAVRADSGEIDQGGGPAWRIKDENNYYICRVNPLEANYRVYVVKDGVRKQLATARVDIATGLWHKLEIEHVGDKITCWLDGKKQLEATDGALLGDGGVGLWTKADALTSFDDLSLAPKTSAGY